MFTQVKASISPFRGRLIVTSLFALALFGGISAHQQAIITTMAGGRPVEGTALNQAISPRVIAASSHGGYYFTDFNTISVYLVDDRSIVQRVAGNGVAGFAGDGGPPLDAKLSADLGVDESGLGGLVITDRSNNRLRAVNPRAHQIQTIAGTGVAGYGGDGGPAIQAAFNGPYETAHDAEGQNRDYQKHDLNTKRKPKCSVSRTFTELLFSLPV